jgi:Inner membrane protein CreD
VLRRIAAITFIFLCTALAWAVLGTTIFVRTAASRTGQEGKVASTWGAPQEQTPPSACSLDQAPGKPLGETVAHSLPLESSRIRIRLDLDPRRKGLLWYSTYKVVFTGVYGFRNTTATDQTVLFTFRFPVSEAIYDDVRFQLDDAPLTLATCGSAVTAKAVIPAARTVKLQVGYRSQGLDWWRYSFGRDVSQVRDFVLTMTTNFSDIDFPQNTLSPTERRETAHGWELTWSYRNLLSGFRIAMEMPLKIQPGPLAAEISYFAPVSLLFFFFMMFIITTLRRIELHPMNYFFLACAFFSFHLLLAYLADHIQIHVAFLICSATAIFLVVSYLRLVVGLRFAAVEAGLAQFIYLVLFSYAFVLNGFTGLAITIGSILTLFVVMQLTGRIRWAERFAR